jgi:hypothetical protein
MSAEVVEITPENRSQWPQVGDKVIVPRYNVLLRINAITDDRIWYKNNGLQLQTTIDLWPTQIAGELRLGSVFVAGDAECKEWVKKEDGE